MARPLASLATLLVAPLIAPLAASLAKGPLPLATPLIAPLVALTGLRIFLVDDKDMIQYCRSIPLKAVGGLQF